MRAPPAALALAQALELFNAGRTVQALSLCQQALAAEPTDPGLQQLLASLLLATDDAVGALRAITQVLARHPGHAPARRLAVQATLRCGQQLLAQNEPARAADLLQALTADQPALGEAWYAYGSALYAAGKPGLSRAAFLTTTRCLPTLVPAWFALALACEDLHHHDEAAAALTQVLALAPDHVEALINLGLVEQTRGRLDTALDLHARAWRLQPDLLGRITMALCSQRAGAVWLNSAGLVQELSRRCPPQAA